jgi:hypothetical protein
VSRPPGASNMQPGITAGIDIKRAAASPMLQAGTPVQLATSFQDDGSQQGSGYTCLSATPAAADTQPAVDTDEQPDDVLAGLPVAAIPDLLLFVVQHLLGEDAELAADFAESFLPLCASDIGRLASQVQPPHARQLLLVRL